MSGLHTKDTDYCMLITEWVWLRSRLCLFSLIPRCGEGGGEKEHQVSTVCACAFKTVSLAGISVTLNSVRLPTFTVWKMHTTTTLCVNDDKGAMKALSFSVARMIHAFVHSS